MKAILLAAGFGTRLGSLTDKTPKCLLPVRGKALLAHWLDKLEEVGVDDVLINGHYRAGDVARFLETCRSHYSFKIHFVYEKTLLGTGGTLKQSQDFIGRTESFFFVHADNYSDVDLNALIQKHQCRQADITMALFRTPLPEQCGIVETMNDQDEILSFVEKPKAPRSNLASAAIFAMSSRVFHALPDRPIFNLSQDVLPVFRGRFFGYKLPGFNIDIGTPEQYDHANRLAIEEKSYDFSRL